MSWEGKYYLAQDVELQAFFVDAGVPVVGAAATIVIYKPSDAPGAPTINGAAMTELGHGIYMYTFAGAGVDEQGVYGVRAAIVASGLYAGGSFRVITDPFIAVMAALASIQADTTALLANVATLQADVTTLLADVTALQADITTLLANLAAVFVEVENIKDGGLGGWIAADDNLHEIKNEIKLLLERWDTQAF